jgi:hypothetical protein
MLMISLGYFTTNRYVGPEKSTVALYEWMATLCACQQANVVACLDTDSYGCTWTHGWFVYGTLGCGRRPSATFVGSRRPPKVDMLHLSYKPCQLSGHACECSVVGP